MREGKVLSDRSGKKKEWGGVTYVCTPCLELSSELVESSTLARNQRNIISCLGKEASDGGAQRSE
jgi:hypothetical protein